MDEGAAREEMCEIGRRLWERGLVGATEGNLSARLGPGRLLCTPSGGSKGHLKPEELLVIDFTGNALREGPAPAGPNVGRAEARPSSEIKLHLRAYEKRPDCGAVVHAHPVTATGFALAGKTIPEGLLAEAEAVLGSVALVPFAMPGTDELPVALEPFLQRHDTFLLGSHGAVALGKDLWDALFRMETLERVARIVLVAERLGGAKALPDDAVRRIRAQFPRGGFE